ncbi:hypothetical protein J7L18_07205 [Candidatus Bathyarchaeota archaeon]|nr:hypothetical protein [Candidatus Bathyarchaeota archaeon]
MRSLKSSIVRWYVYFKRGHNNYFVFALSLLNFIVIQYRLLIEHAPLIRGLIDSLQTFTIVFLSLYIPISILTGWIDTKRGTLPKENEVNPYFIKPIAKERITMPLILEMAKILEQIAERQRLDVEEMRIMRRKVEDWLGLNSNN